MTLHDGFDRTVSDWLDEQAGRGSPDYLADVLTRTTDIRQRPAWSSLERWLPMESIARLAPAPRSAWVLATVALLLLVAATVVLVGSRRPAPSPFGETSRGTVLYAAADGDIYALDTPTNVAVPLIVGETLDTDPTYSPDGSRFTFGRKLAGTTTSLMVADADGSGVRNLVTGFSEPASVAWSPGGDRLAVVATVDERPGLWIVDLDGDTTLVREARIGAMDASFAEPHWLSDEELVFLAGPLDTGTPTAGLYRIRTDGSAMRAVIDPTVPGPAQTSLSPDGTNVAYSVRGSEGAEIHVVDVDTAEDTVIALDGVANDQRPQWSPDGRTLLFERYSGGAYRLAVASVEGGIVTPIGPEQPANSGGSHARFSPDGTRVLAYFESDGSSWVLDPVDGSAIQLGIDVVSPLTWQNAQP